MMAELVRSDGKHLIQDIAFFLNIPESSVTIKKMAWLGLLSDAPIPLSEPSPFELFAHLMQKKLLYAEGETDLLIQHHEFIVTYNRINKEMITSTMAEKGIPGGDSAMARTVGLPAAIAAGLVLKGKISLTGVRVPVVPEVYEPVLEKLKALGIGFKEQSSQIQN